MSRRTTAALLTGGLALLLSALQPADAQTVRNLAGFRTSTLQANDDGSTSAVNLGFAANFFGTTYTTVYVNNNGNITFGGPLGTYTPFGLTTNTAIPIIAAYFADVDTRGTTGAGSSSGGSNAGNVPEPYAGSGLVTYGNATVNGRNAFGIDWFSTCSAWTGGSPGPTTCPDPNGLAGVGYYADHVDKRNVFQMILIDRSDVAAGAFDVEFNYNQIQWETGDASHGANGLGGDCAHVGYSNGTGNVGTFFELPGSGVCGAFLDNGPAATRLVSVTNVNTPSRLLFTVRGGVVSVNPDVPSSTVPEPSTLTLGATGLAGLLVAARGRRRA